MLRFDFRAAELGRWFALSFVALGGCSKPAGQTSTQRSHASALARSTPSATSSEPGAATASASPLAGARHPQAADEQLPASWPQLQTLSGVRADQLRRSLSTSGNRATLVNVWASWCGPCREELPMLGSLAQNLAAQKVGVVLVSADDPEDRPKAEAFLRSFDLRVPAFVVAGSLEAFKVGMNPRWPGMLPATFLFDASGKLRYFWGGPVYDYELMGVIEGFLAGKAIDGEADFTVAPGKEER